jgi:Na+-translocating ferredoxin:NAD+ oxidoreductase RnfA subunit
MEENMNEIVQCAILALLFLNLGLHTGLGIKEIYRDIDASLRGPLIRCAVLSVVVFLFWLLWTFVFTPLSLGFFDTVFIFPFCVLALYAIDEYVLKQKFHEELFYDETPAFSSSPIPLCVISLFMTLRLASSVAEAAIFSLSFSAGSVLSVLILGSIHLRVQSEPISKKISGLPVIFISNGLLAFIFSITATILLRR